MGIIALLLSAWKFTRIPRLLGGAAGAVKRIPPAGWGLIGAFAMGFATSSFINVRFDSGSKGKQVVALSKRLDEQGVKYQDALDLAVKEISHRAKVNATLSKKFDNRIRQIEEGSKRDVKNAIQGLPSCVVGADYIELLNNAATGWRGPDPSRGPPGEETSRSPDGEVPH